MKVYGRVLEVDEGEEVADIGSIDALSYMLGFEGGFAGCSSSLSASI